MFKKIALLFCMLSTTIVFAQDGTCQSEVQEALELSDQYCTATGRNQACYAHYAMEVEAQPDAAAFNFAEEGDITDVASISRIQMMPFDAADNAWGVALMRLQANLPDTLPGQNVTIVLFGDTEVRNAAETAAEQHPPELDVTFTVRSVNMRALPSLDARVVTTVLRSAALVATGRSTDDLWLRVREDDLGETGWMFADLLRVDGDRNLLKVIDTTQPSLNPMQAIHVRTGIGQPACSEALNGMMIQSPSGASGDIHMVINDIGVSLGSTVFFANADDDFTMQILAIEGAVRVTAGNSTRTIVAGSRTLVPLNPDGDASGSPSEASSYADVPVVENIPVSSGLLEREIETAAPLNETRVEALNTNQPIFNAVHLADTGRLLDYVVEESDSGNVADFLINELGYRDLGPQAEDFLVKQLGYDVNDFANYGAIDQDGDEVPDNNDMCPTRRGPVENQGCPAPAGPDADYDRDGVRDADDLCPNVAGRADNAGCPRQS